MAALRFTPMRLRGILAVLLLAPSGLGGVHISEEKIYAHMCDASAGIALSADLFVAADDESNKLRAYSRSRPGSPIHELDLTRPLQIGRGDPETDVEGAAQIGDVVYWITSHGRNKDGKFRPSRQRFFATRISPGTQPRLEFTARLYAGLLRDFAAEPQLKAFNLERASGLAPKDKGALNIEGLCSRPDGSLLIAFRNPVPNKKALLVPLLNPAELVAGKGARAKFGPPIQLDFDKNGVRDLMQQNGTYYIIAGAHNGRDDFQLYSWDGAGAPKLLHDWKGSFNPEAILAVPGETNKFIILSDDGTRKTRGTPCKLLPEASRRFRSVLLTLEP
jgi:hypothetical protein